MEERDFESGGVKYKGAIGTAEYGSIGKCSST